MKIDNADKLIAGRVLGVRTNNSTLLQVTLCVTYNVVTHSCFTHTEW